MCAQYWPEEVGGSATYGKVVVKLVSETTDKDVIARKLEISSTVKAVRNRCTITQPKSCFCGNHAVFGFEMHYNIIASNSYKHIHMQAGSYFSSSYSHIS